MAQYQNRMRVWLFTKTDNIASDQQVADILGIEHYASLHQVHGNRTVVIREASHTKEQADGLITDARNLLLMIRMADCQTFVVVEPKRNVVGLIHAGWRGVNAGIIPAFYKKLNEEWGIEPHETSVGAGPSLCVNCAEFTNPEEEVPNVNSTFIHGTHVDLQSAATAQFLDLGVQESRLARHPDCTCCHPDTYWTYRGGDQTAVKNGARNVLACVLA